MSYMELIHHMTTVCRTPVWKAPASPSTKAARDTGLRCFIYSGDRIANGQ